MTFQTSRETLRKSKRKTERERDDRDREYVSVYSKEIEIRETESMGVCV